jgi:endo-1,3-1,4-beta-glycanase ExoK
MRRLLFLLVVGIAQTMLLAGTTQAQDMSFSDDFTSFDAARWSKGEHVLGRSYLDPANVSVDGRNLRITLPARSLEGGEVLTNDLLGYGSYSARMRLPNAPSSITGFFLYKAPDYESEIDIEIFNDSTRRIMFTTYAGGGQTHTITRTLPFDPTTGFHEYGFDYLQDPISGRASVAFYADGREMMAWNTGVPRTSMHLMLNSWFPSWLDGRRPKKNAYTLVDRISFEAQP